MKKILLLPFLLICAFTVHAQLNNSWIDYSKTYYKFKIAADNICRIPQAAISTAGLNSVNADNFQLWKNGKQVRLYTSVTGAPLGGADFIEFMGEMNDGKADKELYRDPAFQLADRYSLETDTSVYFLTVNPAGPNLRYSSAVNPPPAGSAIPDAYFMRSIDIYYRAKQNRGYAADLGSYVYSSAYDNGEGFTTGDITATNGSPATYTENINGLNVYTAGPSNSLSVRGKFFGNTANSTGTLSFKLFNNEVYSTVRTDITEAEANVTNLPLSYLQNPTSATLTVTNTTTNPQNDRIVIATMGLTYPAVFNFNNLRSFSFDLAASTTGNYLLIDNFKYGTTEPILYDINSGKRYIGDISTPGKVKFVLPPSADPVRKFILNNAEAANINTVNSLLPKTFINFNTPATRGDYIIISHPFLYNDGNGANKVEEYRAYRSSINGGSYNAKIYDINELTDQFAFGIKKHPAAIRDFIRFMDLQYPVKPKFVFIIGRGMTYLDQRNQESNPLSENLGLVTTFGWPASDILLASNPGSVVPITPIGRLGAVNGAEVGYYLDKVLQYEQAQRTQSPLIADKAWMKNVMQVGGGIDVSQSLEFEYYMDAYNTIIKDTLFGGKAELFSKTSSAPVQQANSARISQLFQEGLGFIQYFGHSSATAFAFNLSSPEIYNNTGKYPFFNVSGCTAGNFYTFDLQRLSGNLTLSEKYTLAPQKGSIGFLADTHLGVVPFLHNYNVRLHQEISKINYGQGIGLQIKDVINALGGINPSLDFLTRAHLEEINLHGDPAIKINYFSKPDYAIEDQSVTISPNIISISEPFFSVKIIMRNIGKATNDSIRVSVKRLLPNIPVPVIIMDSLIAAPRNTDSFNINIPINQARDKGMNKLIIKLDNTDRVSENYETNNEITREFFIFENDLLPIYPYNNSIVSTANIVFSASTANPLVGSRNYIMEIDTTALFNSAFKKSYTDAGQGGLIQFIPSGLNFSDSTVYYWRTAVVPANGNYVWNNSSFVYLPNSTPGFNQSHYYQFLKNDYDNIILGTNRVFKYSPLSVLFNIRTAIFPNSVEQDDYSISNGGFIEQNGLAAPYSSNNNALRFYIIDSLTVKSLFNQQVGSMGQYGSNAPTPINSGQTAGYFQFNIITPSQRQIVKQFLDNNVQQGNIIVMVNGGGDSNTHYPAEWATDPGSNLYTTLKAMGFSQIDLITAHVPFVFAVKKGSNIPIVQQIGNYPDLLNVAINVTGVSLSGNIRSEIFGPAKAWDSFHWRGNSLEVPTADSLSFNVIGITAAGVESVLFTVDSTAKDIDISSVNAAQYPFIKLKMFTRDKVAATPYQLRYWRLNYTPVPEGAIAPNILFTMKDTVEVGEPINFSVAFKNVSPYKFDELVKVTLKIKTATNFDSVIVIPKRKTLVAGDTLTVSYTIPTQNYIGSNTLFIEFNGDNDQPEQFHLNNVLFKEFFVKADLFNPLLDVTFDGVHILNRDVVSSKPNILIKLTDDSRFLALKDTGLVKVQLRYPDQTLHNYFFNGDTLRFTPATLTGGKNAASVNFTPYLPEDGEYELIVSGKDVSDNRAGALNYRTVFTVINKPMISELLNYPNPFTTSTAFVFTLTGSAVPQNIRIQILTVTGKIVRELTKEELGPIHIGRNITEGKWDGTDMYGQKLANGVYIYRVITNLNGKSLDKYKAEGDNSGKYFNKGYGKMYLMR